MPRPKTSPSKHHLSLPTISFWRPYWDLCFQKKLVIDGHAVKTFDVPYNYRGLVLCYSGQKAAPGPMRSYRLSPEAVPTGVVGCAFVAESRELTEVDKATLFKGYNNVRSKIDGECKLEDPDSVYGMRYGIFIPLDKLYRFPRPFTPPVQHMFGPRGLIPIYDDILLQLPAWAAQEVHYRLKKASP